MSVKSEYGRFYTIWFGIRRRCYNKNNTAYHNYGARGIRVNWRSFSAFRRDMYASYQAHCKEYGEHNTTLDRVDNDKNYSAKNCKWSTYSEQNRNKRTNYLITYKGKTKPLIEWAEEFQMARSTIRWRIEKMKLPLDKVFIPTAQRHFVQR